MSKKKISFTFLFCDSGVTISNVSQSTVSMNKFPGEVNRSQTSQPKSQITHNFQSPQHIEFSGSNLPSTHSSLQSAAFPNSSKFYGRNKIIIVLELNHFFLFHKGTPLSTLYPKNVLKRKYPEFDNQSVGSMNTDAVSFDEYDFDDESTNESFLNKRKRVKGAQKERMPSARTNIDNAMALQKETNQLLAQIISQNDTMIELMTDLVAKFP